MPTQTMLSDIRNHKRCNTTKLFELLNRLAKVFLFQEVQIKLIIGFEHALQCLANPLGRFQGAGQTFQRLRQFRRRRNPNLVPIEEIFLQAGKRFIGTLGRRILQATGVKHVVKHRPIGRWQHSFVLFFDELVQFGQLISSVFCSHGRIYQTLMEF